jgi:hypothetical protein
MAESSIQHSSRDPAVFERRYIAEVCGPFANRESVDEVHSRGRWRLHYNRQFSLCVSSLYELISAHCISQDVLSFLQNVARLSWQEHNSGEVETWHTNE